MFYEGSALSPIYFGKETGVRLVQYFGRNTGIANLGSHFSELFPIPLFYRAFAFVVDNERTLLRLFRGVAAHFLERFDNMFKRIHIVVENYQLVGFHRNGYQFFFEVKIGMIHVAKV